MKSKVLFSRHAALLALMAGLAVVACGDDDDDDDGTAGHSGTGKGGSSGTSYGGKSGSSSGGKSGSATGGTSNGGSGAYAGTAGEGGEPSEGYAGEAGAGGAVAAIEVMRTDLTADEALVAAHQDENLINAWGLSFDPDPDEDTAFWVSATDSGVSTVYSSDGTPASLVVTIPFVSGGTMGSPTGQVYNPTTDFEGDKFIFATEDGMIAGWASGTAAVMRATTEDAGYTGLTLFMNGADPMLAAANFPAATIDVFDGTYALVGSDLFVDPELPAGYAPFNVQALADKVYVAYAKQDAAMEEEEAGPGNGYVSVFDVDGTFDRRLVSRGALNAPWGLALAPESFEPAPGQLIVGNFGDGWIHSYDVTTGALMGVLSDDQGAPIEIEGLWALAFGPNKTAEDLSNQLFFTAGPEEETHGLFGKLTVP